MAIKFDTLELLTKDQLDLIHEKTIELLSKVGFVFMHEESVEIFKKHGFKTDKDIVYFTEKSINHALETVGNSFTLMARNPEHTIHFDMDTFSTGLGGGAVWTVNADGSFHPSTMDDCIKFMKLGQMLDQVETCRPLLIPMDIKEATLNPAWLTASMVRLQDKPYHYMSSDELDIVRMGYGVTRETMQKDAEKNISYGQSSINVISPLALGSEQCRHMLEFVRHGVVFNLAPMPSGGTTAPITLAGEIIQQNCENLAPLVLCQLIRPGMPILYGTIGSHTDMRNMATIFGSPETRIIEYASAQLARHYNMLSRGDVGIVDAPSSDFQAGAESMFQFVNAARAGINFLPGMGHLGSFMGGSFAKLVLDSELAAYTKRYLKPVDFTEDTMVTDLIAKVGPRGQYITEAHTLKHCRSEYLFPSIFQRISYDAWGKKGAPTALEIAEKKANKLISQYKEPTLGDDLAKDLDKHMQKTYGL